MEAATRGRARVPFPVPSGVTAARIDPRTGLLAYEGQSDAIDEVFLEPVPRDDPELRERVMARYGGALRQKDAGG